MANPTLITTPIAENGAKNNIPNTVDPSSGKLSQEKGWDEINSIPLTDGGKAPDRLDFNGVLNLLSKILFYAQKGFTFEYDETQDYYAKCIVLDPADGKMYRAKNDVSASATHPSADSTNWELFDLLTLLANYLPLAGGTLSGDLKTSANIFKSADTGVFDIRVGNDILEDGGVRFIGKNQGGANAGASFFYGAKGTNPATPYVGIRSDGSLVCSTTGLGSDERDLGGSAIVAKSISGSGYRKTADGLIIQWGKNSSDNAAVQVDFPISFTTDYHVIATIESSRYNTTENFEVRCYNQSNSFFKAYVKHDGSPADIGFSWIAIGK